MLIDTQTEQSGQISIMDFLRRYPVLILLAAITLTADICYKMMLPLVPLYFTGRGWSKVLAGSAQSAFVLSETALKPFAGGVGDRMRRTHLIMASLALGIITPFFYSKAAGPGTFLTIRFIDGLGAAALWPAMIALFADATDEKHRATAMSIFTMCMLGSLGIGFTLSPFIKALSGSYNYVFISMSALMACALLTTTISSRRIGSAVKLQSQRQSQMPNITSLKENLKKIATDWQVLTQLVVLTFIAFMQMLGTSVVTHTTFFFAVDEVGWTEKQLWRVIPLVGAFIGLLALPAGRLADRVGKETSVKIAMSLSAVCLGLTVLIREPWTLGAAVLGYGIGFVLGAPAWMALITRGEWAGLRSTVLGIITAFQGAGAVIGLNLGPLLYGDGLNIDMVIGNGKYSLTGHYAPFGACAIILALCAVVSFIGLRPIRKPKSN